MMHTEKITVDRAAAEVLFRKYKEHAAYSDPIDWEVQRTYDLLRKGKVIIRALESIKQAGLNRDFLPKLAITPANAEFCYLTRYSNGAIRMSPRERWARIKKNVVEFRSETFLFPAESFPLRNWGSGKHRDSDSHHKAQVPVIPAYLKPKRGLANYHILWEAEWEPVPPTDPYLLRRIGKADLWLVVAHWELTEVEMAALSTRV
jgi:hypothetical protein